ncbi:MAG: dipeptidase, partial [Bacteroidales bacterium]
AFWLFNLVTNLTYGRYSDMIKDVRAKQFELESRFISEVEALDKKLIAMANENKADQINSEITRFSNRKSEETFSTWKTLSQYLLVKYMDGNIKKEKDGRFEESEYRKGQNVFPMQPHYNKKWLETIVKDHGETIKVPKK